MLGFFVIPAKVLKSHSNIHTPIPLSAFSTEITSQLPPRPYPSRFLILNHHYNSYFTAAAMFQKITDLWEVSFENVVGVIAKVQILQSVCTFDMHLKGRRRVRGNK